MPDKTTIGERLIELRGETPQTKVAFELDVSQNTISSWETGLRVPRDQHKKLIADYYGVTVQSIFFD